MSERPKNPGARPRAFRLDDPNVVLAGAEPAARGAESEARPPPSAPPAPRDSIVVEAQPDPYAREIAGAPTDPTEAAVEEAQKSGVRGRGRWTWGGIFWSAVGSLVSLGVGIWLTALVEGFSRDRQRSAGSASPCWRSPAPRSSR